MAKDNFSKLRLYEDQWNESRMTDENSLSNALLTQPDVLSPVLTHLAGREDKRFPLSFLTEGIGNVKYIQDTEYDYPVMGRLDRAVRAVDLKGSGIGHSKFKVTFESRWFVRQYLIESPNGEIQARIYGDPVETDKGWEYTLQLNTTDPNQSVTASQVVGRQWVQLFAPVTTVGGSRGNESNWVAPSKMRNQISLIRKSYRYQGNAPDRVMNLEFNVKGKKTKLWWDFEEFQHFLKWKEEGENMLWYSRYNRDADGEIHLKDENGNPIPLGSGVLEQIPNTDSYAFLTAKKIKSVIRDAVYGASDAQKMNIVLYTGTGGREEFDNAMKDEVAAGNYIKNTNPTMFVSGSGRSLKLGGFFTQYEHVDGHTITIRYLPMLDHGSRALNSDPHPITGLPLESYRMIFLDQSIYDGEPNVKMVTQKNREMKRWAVAGATIPKGFEGNALRASDVDGGSVHFMKAGGIAIRRATNCIHLTCKLS